MKEWRSKVKEDVQLVAGTRTGNAVDCAKVMDNKLEEERNKMEDAAEDRNPRGRGCQEAGIPKGGAGEAGRMGGPPG